MTSVLFRVVAAASVAATTWVVIGCVSEPVADPVPSDPYASVIDEIRDETSSEFVKTILEDYKISDSEVKEAEKSFVSCLEDGGLNPLVETDEDGFSSVAMPSGQESNQTFKDCEAKWDAGIGNLYRQMRTNPENVPWFDLVAACLVKEGFTPEGLTGKELEKIYTLGGTKYVSDGESSIPVEGPKDPDPKLPGGHKLFSEETAECVNDPHRVLGTVK